MLSRAKKADFDLWPLYLMASTKYPSSVTTRKIEHALQNQPLPDWRLVLRGLFHQCRLGDCGVARRADFICRLNAGEVRATAAGTPYRQQRVSIAVGVCAGLAWLIEALSHDAPSDRENVSGWPSSLWVERLRTSRVRAFWRRSSSCLLTKRPATIPCGCCPVR